MLLQKLHAAWEAAKSAYTACERVPEAANIVSKQEKPQPPASHSPKESYAAYRCRMKSAEKMPFPNAGSSIL